MKTGQEVENDVYELFKGGSIASVLTGGVYKFGMRPKDSSLEDAVVKFVTGFDDQIQTGTVVVNIYVPDIDYGNGVLVRDISRCTEIEIAAHKWVKSLTVSDYYFSLAQTIYTEEESEIKQHFVTVRIRFKLVTF